jgi:hypothetical protein
MQAVDRLNEDINAFTSDSIPAPEDARVVSASDGGRVHEKHISDMGERIKSSLTRLVELDRMCNDAYKRRAQARPSAGGH